MAACLPIALVVLGMLVSDIGLGGFSASGFGGGDGRLFVPLFAVETLYERFTMFSRAHLAAFGNELLLVAPVGVILALTGWLGRRRDGRRTDSGTWVLLAALGTVVYAFAFNPDMMVGDQTLGVLNEWDLFAFEAVPITLLGSVVVAHRVRSRGGARRPRALGSSDLRRPHGRFSAAQRGGETLAPGASA